MTLTNLLDRLEGDICKIKGVVIGVEQGRTGDGSLFLT